MSSLNYNTSIKLLFLLLFFSYAKSYCQVSIGTNTPDDGSVFEIESTTGAFIPPRMTDTQMNAIPTPLNGAVVYNTTTNSLSIRKNGVWNSIENGSLVLNRNGGSIMTPDNTYNNFPLSTGNITSLDNSVYAVTGNGAITIKKAGVYMLSASFSTSNLPAGVHKYIIGVYRGGTLIGYLSRGFVTVPGTGSDYFGASGVLMYTLNSNDSIEFRYVLNNGGNTIAAAFFNIGVSKMQ